MVSDQKIIEILGTIRTLYPFYAKDKENGDVKIMGRAWRMALSEYSDTEIEQAFTKCLKKCKMPPTPADVIEEIESREQITEEDASAYWFEYVSACRKASELTYYFPFTFVEANGKSQGENARDELLTFFNSLSYPVKRYIGSYGILIEKGMNYDSNEFKYEKPGFIKEMLATRKQPKAQLLTEKTFEQLLIEGG